MARIEYPAVEFKSHFSENITAWVDGKLLGVVRTDGDGVFVRLNPRTLRNTSSCKSATASLQDAVEQCESASGSSNNGGS